MFDYSLQKLLSGNIPAPLDVKLFQADMKLLILAPHPDDFDAIGITLRRFQDNGNPISLAVISSGASGVENSYLRNAGDSSVKALIREREQYESTVFFGLGKDDLIFLRAEEDENGDIQENEVNLRLIADCLKKVEPDIVFMPHWNDTNAGHCRSYKLAKKTMAETTKKHLLLLNKDPKTIRMPIKLYSAFNGDGEDVAWKRRLLKYHASQQQRNLNTRRYGFDERILEFNRQCAAEINENDGYAEVFDLEINF